MRGVECIQKGLRSFFNQFSNFRPGRGVCNVQAAKLNDNLIQKVIHLILIIAFTEFRLTEPLVNYVFWSENW